MTTEEPVHAEGAGADEGTLLAWTGRVRVLRNSVLAAQILVPLALASIGLGILVGLTGGRWKAALAATTLPLLFFGGAFVVVGLVIDALGGFPLIFRMTKRGIHCQQSPEVRAAVGATLVGGLLLGSMQTTAAGLLARSERDVFIPWDRIASVTRSRSRRLILVRPGRGSKPIGLWGSAETLDRALDLIRRNRPDVIVRDARLPLF